MKFLCISLSLNKLTCRVHNTIDDSHHLESKHQTVDREMIGPDGNTVTDPCTTQHQHLRRLEVEYKEDEEGRRNGVSDFGTQISLPFVKRKAILCQK